MIIPEVDYTLLPMCKYVGNSYNKKLHRAKTVDWKQAVLPSFSMTQKAKSQKTYCLRIWGEWL
jgi:hypothetical protein